MEGDLQNESSHHRRHARHDRLQHGGSDLRRANRRRRAGGGRFAGFAVLSAADDARHADRRRWLHGDLHRARREGHGPRQSVLRRVRGALSYERRAARQRDAAFPRRFPASFRCGQCNLAVYEGLSARACGRHTDRRVLKRLCKPRARRGRCQGSGAVQRPRHGHEHRPRSDSDLRLQDGRAGRGRRDGARQPFFRRCAALLPAPRAHRADAEPEARLPQQKGVFAGSGARRTRFHQQPADGHDQHDHQQHRDPVRCGHRRRDGRRRQGGHDRRDDRDGILSRRTADDCI